MKRHGHRTICAAMLVAAALVAAACASSGETASVDSESAEYGASLQTSTTIADDTGRGGSDRASRGTGSGSNKGGDPGGLPDISNLTTEQLSEITGLDAKELGTLGITPETVGALASVLDDLGSGSDGADGSPDASQQAALVSLLGSGSGSLLTGTGQLTAEAAGVLAGLNIDPVTFAALVGTAMTVPESVTESLGTLLAIVDPNGLGQFRANRSALALISVILAAMIGRDPVDLGRLANAGQIDPRFAGVTKFIFNLATGLSPQLIDRINNITGILGPYTIRALGAAFALLERPDVGRVFEEAFSDPVTVATAFGAAFLSIPGLPELVAPNTFSDPRAIYAAVIGIAAVSLLNADAPGFRDFLARIGIEVPERPAGGG